MCMRQTGMARCTIGRFDEYNNNIYNRHKRVENNGRERDDCCDGV